MLQLVRGQSLPISSGPPWAALPLWESSAGNVRMGIFPSYLHADHILYNTQSLFQGIKWVEMLLQCLLGWCDTIQMHLGILCRLPWFKNSVPLAETQLWISKICIHPLKNVISQAHYLTIYISSYWYMNTKRTAKKGIQFLGDMIIWEKSLISLSEKFVAYLKTNIAIPVVPYNTQKKLIVQERVLCCEQI